MERLLEGHPRVYYAGYVEDTQKEYAEANATLAFGVGAKLAGADVIWVWARRRTSTAWLKP